VQDDGASSALLEKPQTRRAVCRRCERPRTGWHNTASRAPAGSTWPTWASISSAGALFDLLGATAGPVTWDGNLPRALGGARFQPTCSTALGRPGTIMSYHAAAWPWPGTSAFDFTSRGRDLDGMRYLPASPRQCGPPGTMPH